MPSVKRDENERFDEKVHKLPGSGCWEWVGLLDASGYGRFFVTLPTTDWRTQRRGKKLRAHRFSYERAYGPIADGLFVCHRCDNPKCVRPDHLFAGTTTDNMRDALAKGRLNLAGLLRGARHMAEGYVDPRRKSHCVRGHNLDQTGVKTKWNNARVCRECVKVRRRKRASGQ